MFKALERKPTAGDIALANVHVDEAHIPIADIRKPLSTIKETSIVSYLNLSP